ncbi:MAG TPA: MFS transporter [Chloroflexi bacterium]|nr:MFS transporter [Chloroflexota bacterium]
MWGVAFAGAPVAQFVLAQMVRPRLGAAQRALEQAVIAAVGADVAALAPPDLARLIADALVDPAVRASVAVAPALQALDAAWRSQMTLLGVLVLAALALAALAARRRPEQYELQPFGSLKGAPAVEYEWRVGDAFARYAIWGAILTFLTSMMAEFLIWTQVVSYWTDDVGYSLQQATGIYAIIGLIGIASMPLMGRVADWVVQAVGHEARGRKIMLLVGPSTGAVACILLLVSGRLALAYAACFVFAVYWAIVPGGVVGYVGATYGSRTLGKIWGLATLIVMGIGPFAGSFIGGLLRDLSGNYTLSIYYALGSFVVSTLLAASLPLKVDP